MKTRRSEREERSKQSRQTREDKREQRHCWYSGVDSVEVGENEPCRESKEELEVQTWISRRELWVIGGLGKPRRRKLSISLVIGVLERKREEVVDTFGDMCISGNKRGSRRCL